MLYKNCLLWQCSAAIIRSNVLLFILAIFLLGITTKGYAAETIKLAAIFSKSGIAASHNAPLLEMTELTIESINNNGGVLGRQIELIVLDNKSTPIGSVLAAKKAIELDVVAVIGGHWSSHSLAMAPIFQDAGVPMISPASTHPDITKIGDYIFRVCFIDSFQGKAMAQFAIENLGVKRAAVVSNVDEKYSTTLAKYFSEEFQSASGEVIADIQYRGDATDFSDIIAQIKRRDPDIIYLPGYTRDSGLFIKQARRLGLFATFLGGDSWDEITAVTDNDIDGSYQTAAWHPMVQNETSDIVKKLYSQKYGKNISNYSSPLAFDTVMILKEAISKCNCTDREKIKESLFSLDPFMGATGKIDFNRNGDPDNKEIMVIQFQKKKPVFVKVLRP